MALALVAALSLALGWQWVSVETPALQARRLQLRAFLQVTWLTLAMSRLLLLQHWLLQIAVMLLHSLALIVALMALESRTRGWLLAAVAAKLLTTLSKLRLLWAAVAAPACFKRKATCGDDD